MKEIPVLEFLEAVGEPIAYHQFESEFRTPISVQEWAQHRYLTLSANEQNSVLAACRHNEQNRIRRAGCA
jgi:hypothetical protein